MTTRIRVFIVLALAMTVGGVFAFATYRYVQNVPAAKPNAAIQTRPVVIAVANLDLGASLRREDVRTIDWPAESVPAGAFSDVQEVIGRGLIQPVVQNEAILPSKLASKEAGAGLPPVIKPGYRALSVRVNDVIGVAGYVLPGTHVDVVATISPSAQPNDVTSKIVLTDVEVLASGTKIERDTEQGKPIAVSVVTLLVDPAEVERLTLASTEGKIQLALRNPLDAMAPTTSGIRPAGLLGAIGARPVARVARVASVAAAPKPSAPAPTPTVEIIRGDKRTEETVRQE
jgi:pilus assembly protein CpaB